MAASLYICYFGLREPLVRTQVIPYLRELADGGHQISLITFEPEKKTSWTPEQISAERAGLAAFGIDWHCLAYHKRPSAIATAYDVLVGSLFVRRFIDREQIDILHGRVHIPTLMGVIARRFSRRKPKLLFDIRGFFPEEYTDAGVWPENGWLYKAAKRVERWLMNEAEGFVVLTEKARDILFPSVEQFEKPVEVIPCCVDLESRFQPNDESSGDDIRETLGIDGRFVITHVGALIGLYMSREIVDMLAAAREVEPRTFAMLLTQSPREEIVNLLKQQGFTEQDYFVTNVKPAEIPSYLSACDVGLSFVKASYATQSRSPTKIPEYLAAGLPIIANPGVGDVDRLITDEGVGVLIDSFDREAYLNAINSIKSMSDVNEKCRETAKRRFDLKTVGGPRYRRIYERLLEDRR